MAQPVLIVGGGIGGLTLANILTRDSIACAVYEADDAPHSRPQGGSLDLRADAGQTALKAADLFEEWKAVARCEDQQIHFYNKRGKKFFEYVVDGKKVFRPEIDRGQLRDVLLAKLDPSVVHWGHRLASIEVVKNIATGVNDSAAPSFVCRFSSGATTTVSMVVGADGAFSKVRDFLCGDGGRPADYSGVSYMQWRLAAGATAARLAPFCLKGNEAVFGKGGRLFLQRNSDATYVYAFVKVGAEWNKEFGDGSNVQGAQLLAKMRDTYFKDWSPAVTQIFEPDVADVDSIVLRPICELPIDFRWKPLSGVTLVGDAAHLMSPFAGEGANQAMLNAFHLADAIKHQRLGVADAIAAHEVAMHRRSAWSARASALGLRLHFGTGVGASLGRGALFGALVSAQAVKNMVARLRN